MQPNNEQDPDNNWSFRNEDDATMDEPRDAYQAQPAAPSEPVTWTASEFISHHKNPGWYLALIGSFILLGIVIYFLTKDIISIVAIAVVFILFLIVSGKKPEQRQYQVSDQGVSIGDKFYPYNLFKSFTMRQEGAIGSITFMPLKRLMTEISIYYAPEDEARIVDVLTASLPLDQRREQSVDRLMKHLRF